MLTSKNLEAYLGNAVVNTIEGQKYTILLFCPSQTIQFFSVAGHCTFADSTMISNVAFVTLIFYGKLFEYNSA